MKSSFKYAQRARNLAKPSREGQMEPEPMRSRSQLVQLRASLAFECNFRCIVRYDNDGALRCSSHSRFSMGLE